MSGRAELSRSFGQVAEEYDRWRPSYPGEAVAWVADNVEGRRAAEIGAGTGKATVQFLRFGFSVTAVEPDRAMVEVGKARVPAAEWLVATAESWRPQPETFDLLYGAQSWHWVDERSDSELAQAIIPGGMMAWLWNHPSLHIETEVLGDIYARYMPESDESLRNANHRRQPAYWQERMERVMADVEVLEVPWERTLSAADYVSLTGTYSDHITLAPDDRRALQEAVRQRLELQGGSITLEYLTRVYLGVRR